jgi:MoxR-like ATPase
LVVWAVDWEDLTGDEKRKVADPSGEGKICNDAGKLKKQLESWRKAFVEQLDNCPRFILEYVTAVINALNGAGVRISPRRSRLMARSLLAATIVEGRRTQRLFRLILTCSLPHVAWGVEVEAEIISAAHRAAWNTASEDEGSWIHAFMAESLLPKKLSILLNKCQNRDESTQAIAQFIASEPRERVAALAFALYPAAVMEKLPIGADGVNDLGKIATPILSVDGEVSWQERLNQSQNQHPEFDRFTRVIGKRRGGQRERAKQFFNWCLVEKVNPENPDVLEDEIESCVRMLKRRGLV